MCSNGIPLLVLPFHSNPCGFATLCDSLEQVWVKPMTGAQTRSARICNLVYLIHFRIKRYWFRSFHYRHLFAMWMQQFHHTIIVNADVFRSCVIDALRCVWLAAIQSLAFINLVSSERKHSNDWSNCFFAALKYADANTTYFTWFTQFVLTWWYCSFCSRLNDIRYPWTKTL